MIIRKKTIYLLIILTLLVFYYISQNLPKSALHLPNDLTPADQASTPTQQPFTATSSVSLATTDLETAQVTRVVDGDTIEVNLNGKTEKIRYLEMNTPETVDPRRPVQCFGHEASDENKSLVSGKTVILTKDVSDTDKYNRLLRFVYLPVSDGKLLFVNDYLVREGYAQVDIIPPDVKYVEQFIQAQNEAEAAKKGLWAKCGGNI